VDYNFDNASLRHSVGAAEWETRVNLAAVFRACYHFGWNDTVRNHATARIPDAPDQFLMNPARLGWHEITASSLLRLDLDGNILGESDLGPGPAGLNFHSAILREMPEIQSTFHIHPIAGIVVSATEEGLIYVDQGGCSLYGDVAYHDFEGLAEEADEAPRIIADFRDKHAMIMRNHGLLTIGRTIGEAFSFMHRLIDACETQVQLMSTGAPIRRISQEVLEHTSRQMKARRGNTPGGALDWAMYFRLAESLDPSFKS
jgi:ribulose-5-phosphate 4-epimerase/fuculose-1-phosphate aldolase